VIGYASRTGTKRNLDALRNAGWGLMLSPADVLRTEGFENYALDNGAWTAYQQKQQWDEAAFVDAVERFGKNARFIVAPDIVAGGFESLARSFEWTYRLPGRVLVPVQDGISVEDLDQSPLWDRIGIFVGGTTDWKLRTLPYWGRFARRVGCYLHVGRVNSVRRIAYASACGADSFDGTSVSRYAVNIGKLDKARRQMALRLDA
jgi:hypothetical protein